MRKLFSQILEKEVLQPMAKCQFCDKGVSFGIQVSHSHRRSNRTWKPNVKRVKAIVDGKPHLFLLFCSLLFLYLLSFLLFFLCLTYSYSPYD